MTIRRVATTRNALMAALSTARGQSAQVQLRTGANSSAGGQGSLLAQLTGNSSGWATAAVNGVLTSRAITADSSADATGTVGHYQINTSAGVYLESGLVGAGQDGVTIDNPTIVMNQRVQMSGNWVDTAAYA